MLDSGNLPLRFQGKIFTGLGLQRWGKPYLDMSGVLTRQNLSTRLRKRSLHLLAKLWHFVR